MEKDKIDYKIIIDSGIKFIEDGFITLKKTLENSSIAKNNKIEIDTLMEVTLQKTLSILDIIRLKLDFLNNTDNIADISDVIKLEKRLSLLEKKVSSLGFATKFDLKTLEDKIMDNIKNGI